MKQTYKIIEPTGPGRHVQSREVRLTKTEACQLANDPLRVVLRVGIDGAVQRIGGEWKNQRNL